MNITPNILPINHTHGRGGKTPDMLVIHVTEGNASSVRSWFRAKQAEVSAHYMVCVDGTIEQFVDEDDQAWHAGRVDKATAPLVLARPHVNPNSYSIGIEHEGTGKAPLTAPQRAASVALIRDICQRRSIPMNRTHIVGHHEIFFPKTCPGKIDVDELVALAATSYTPRPQAPLVVWSGYANDWLIVTSVKSDADWRFVAMADVNRAASTQAQSPLSAMERA